MRFFTRAARNQLGTEDGRRQWHALIDDYLRHLNLVWPVLPANARRLARLGLHDSRVVKAHAVSDTELRLTLDTRASHSPYPALVLAFRGVSDSSVPATIAGDTWLYEEVDSADGAAFQLRVLLAEGELMVAANDVAILGCFDSR